MTARYGIRKSDKWIPWYFVAFFIVLFILDGIFVSLALSTHRGVVTEQPYQKGLAYNQTIEAADKQAALAWSSHIEVTSDEVRVLLKDKMGDPLLGAKVMVYLSRPTQAGDDFSVRLSEGENGRYESPVTFKINGQWDVRVSALRNKERYQQRKRVVIQ